MMDKKTPIRKSRTKAAKALTKTEQNVVLISEHKKKIDVLKEEIASLEASVITAMDEAGQTTQTIESGGERITASIVRGERVEIDDDKLAKKVGAPMWRKISSLVLDKAKLAEEIKTGAVSEVDVAAVSTIKKNKPYVKVTRK